MFYKPRGIWLFLIQKFDGNQQTIQAYTKEMVRYFHFSDIKDLE